MDEFINQLECLSEQGIIAKYQKDKYLKVYEKADTNKRLWYDKNLMILINTKQKITEIKYLKSISNILQFFFSAVNSNRFFRFNVVIILH